MVLFFFKGALKIVFASVSTKPGFVSAPSHSAPDPSRESCFLTGPHLGFDLRSSPLFSIVLSGSHEVLLAPLPLGGESVLFWAHDCVGTSEFGLLSPESPVSCWRPRVLFHWQEPPTPSTPSPSHHLKEYSSRSPVFPLVSWPLLLPCQHPGGRKNGWITHSYLGQVRSQWSLLKK